LRGHSLREIPLFAKEGDFLSFVNGEKEELSLQCLRNYELISRTRLTPSDFMSKLDIYLVERRQPLPLRLVLVLPGVLCPPLG